MKPPAVELAAGAICWRPAESGLELLLVHSARWGDWSWPKGKLEPGESLPSCAVREVLEETGVRVELGQRLPGSAYVLPDGRHKQVSYWAGRVIATGPASAPTAEIDAVAWLPAEQALARLTRPGDPAPAQALLDLAGTGRLDTRPLLVLRHAKAVGRGSWRGSEADRPLTGGGRRQAAALPALLACWAPDRVLSSPWARCTQTLEPYLADRTAEPARQPVELLPLLSEQGLHDDPADLARLLDDLLGAGRQGADQPGTGRLGAGQGVLVCTHRPLLAPIVAKLREVAVPNLSATKLSAARMFGEFPAEDPWLPPAGVLVAHVHTAAVLAVEQHLGESPRKGRRQRR